jgi:hypothetical protein
MPSKDYEFYGDRYVNIGEQEWYTREDIHSGKIPTECIVCMEAENEMYTAYAHPTAHVEAHAHATTTAHASAVQEKDTDSYIDYYIFYYGREYRKIYTELYTRYKKEYSVSVLERSYGKDDKICQYHLESIQYHCNGQ